MKVATLVDQIDSDRIPHGDQIRVVREVPGAPGILTFHRCRGRWLVDTHQGAPLARVTRAAVCHAVRGAQIVSLIRDGHVIAHSRLAVRKSRR